MLLPFPVTPNHVTTAGLVLGLLGAWWLAAAAVLLGTYLRRGRLPYGLGWWAFTFPLGAYTASTLALARAWDAGALEALTAILFVGLCVFWVVVATRTLGAVRSGAVWRR